MATLDTSDIEDVMNIPESKSSRKYCLCCDELATSKEKTHQKIVQQWLCGRKTIDWNV